MILSRETCQSKVSKIISFSSTGLLESMDTFVIRRLDSPDCRKVVLEVIFSITQQYNFQIVSRFTVEIFGGRILLSRSSQAESLVMRVRLEGRKKPITNMH